MTRLVLSAPPSTARSARHLSHVERAIRSLRRGEAVACRVEVAGECQDWSIVAVDGLESEQFDRFAADAASRLILAGPRARALDLPVTADDTAAVRLSGGLDLAHLAPIVDPVANARREAASLAPAPPAAVDGAAVELAKLAELLPAVLVRPADRIERDALPAGDILDYRKRIAGVVRRVSEANVPLRDHERTRIVAFRPGDGGPDHLALILGEPALDRPVLVRVHSSCVTGDLLGSLRCDCGDQLRGAIAKISQQGAGVLLYLSQEGRGIGIANKLRAYRLQDSGFDTVDANDQLGFAPDERSYAVAAEILRQLGVRQVRLLTNNPEKLAALAQHGVDVVERVPHIFAPTEHSARYLAAKARRSGHLL